MSNGGLASARTSNGSSALELFIAPYVLFWRHGRLLMDSVVQTLRLRYAGSILGLAWLALGPMILLSLYAVLYTVILRIQPAELGVLDYTLYIFSGLIPFVAFSQALSGGAGSLAQDRALLLNKLFPAELIPAREVLAGGVTFVAGIGMIVVLKTALGQVSASWLALPIVSILLFMFTMGLVWSFALANLFLKDVQQAIGYLVMILMVISPIAYTPSMVPENFRILLYANPFAYYVQSVQRIIVLGELPSTGILLGCFVFSMLSFHGFYLIFRSGKLIIADHI